MPLRKCMTLNKNYPCWHGSSPSLYIQVKDFNWFQWLEEWVPVFYVHGKGTWVTVVTPSDRRKSVRNRCVIDLFYGVACVVTFPFWHFCWCMGFYHRTESDLPFFLLVRSGSRSSLFQISSQLSKVRSPLLYEKPCRSSRPRERRNLNRNGFLLMHIRLVYYPCVPAQTRQYNHRLRSRW